MALEAENSLWVTVHVVRAILKTVNATMTRRVEAHRGEAVPPIWSRSPTMSSPPMGIAYWRRNNLVLYVKCNRISLS